MNLPRVPVEFPWGNPSRDPGFLQVLEALKERRTLPVSNALAEMAVGDGTRFEGGVRKGNPPLFYYGNPKPSFLGVITITHILGCKTFREIHGFLGIMSGMKKRPS